MTFVEERQFHEKQPEQMPSRPHRYNSHHARSISESEHDQGQIKGMGQSSSESDNRRGGRKGALLYHIQGRSLRDQINKMAQEGTTRISEDTEKDPSSDVVLPSGGETSQQLQHQDYSSAGTLAEEFADSSSSSAQSSSGHGTLGLVTTPGLFTLQESKDEFEPQSITSVEPEVSPNASLEESPTPIPMAQGSSISFPLPPSARQTSLNPTPRRKTPREGQQPSIEVGFTTRMSIQEDGSTSLLIEDPTAHYRTLSLKSMTFDSRLGSEVQSDGTQQQTIRVIEPSDTESEHEEIINEGDNKQSQSIDVDRSRSTSPRSLTSSLGFVSACNEPWQSHFGQTGDVGVSDINDDCHDQLSMGRPAKQRSLTPEAQYVDRSTRAFLVPEDSEKS